MMRERSCTTCTTRGQEDGYQTSVKVVVVPTATCYQTSVDPLTSLFSARTISKSIINRATAVKSMPIGLVGHHKLSLFIMTQHVLETARFVKTHSSSFHSRLSSACDKGYLQLVGETMGTWPTGGRASAIESPNTERIIA